VDYILFYVLYGFYIFVCISEMLQLYGICIFVGVSLIPYPTVISDYLGSTECMYVYVYINSMNFHTVCKLFYVCTVYVNM
jgi:hypothetical protein